MNEDEFRAWKEIKEVRVILEKHIEDESPWLNVVHELGTAERVRAQVQFVEMLIEREKDRVKLRRAVIEKSTIGALWAVLIFVAVAIFNEIKRHM